MVFENFELPRLEEGNCVRELEVCGSVLRGRGEFLGAVGTDDVQADKLLGD